MKKILGIIVLSFLLGENAYANNGYLLEDNLFTNCDILTKKDVPFHEIIEVVISLIKNEKILQNIKKTLKLK